MPAVRPEHQLPDAGVQPVRADHQIELPCRAPRERHGAVRADCGDVISEQILDGVAARVVEDLAQVVPHDLDVPVRQRGGQLVVVDLRWAAGAPAVEDDPLGAGGVGHHGVEHPHFLGYPHRRPEQVDGVPAGLAQLRRPFDHRDLEAVTAQPIGEHRSGDARTRNQNPHVCSLLNGR